MRGRILALAFFVGSHGWLSLSDHGAADALRLGPFSRTLRSNSYSGAILVQAISHIGDSFGAGVLRRGDVGSQANVRGRWRAECYAPNGELKWTEEFENIVVNEGLNHLLDSSLAGQTQITSWFVGLKGTGTPAATDTMASHGTWSEDQNYSEANRQAWTPNGAASGQSVSNSSAKATFSINANTTIYGAFLTSNNTKGGTSGKLYAAGNFASSKTLGAGDQLLVTATFTTADDGV